MKIMYPVISMVLPNVGSHVPTKNIHAILKNLLLKKYFWLSTSSAANMAAGSVGGALAAGTIEIHNNIIYRIS